VPRARKGAVAASFPSAKNVAALFMMSSGRERGAEALRPAGHASQPPSWRTVTPPAPRSMT
jgi:hypothetical protein